MWKTFQVFNRSAVTASPPSTTTDGAAEVKQIAVAPLQNLPSPATRSLSTKSFLVFCSSEAGNVRLVDATYTHVDFQAFPANLEPAALLQGTTKGDMLFTVCPERKDASSSSSNPPSSSGGGFNYVVRIFDLAAIFHAGGGMGVEPKRTFTIRTPSHVRSFSVLEDLTQLALGMANGCVLVLEGTLLQPRQPRQHMVQREGEPVLDVYYNEATELRSEPTLFVVTESKVLTLLTGRRLNSSTKQITLDAFPKNMDILCTALTGDNDLIVGTSDAVYFYHTDEKGICFGEKGSKKQIMWFDSYLAVVSQSKTNAKRDTVIVYDLKNKFIAFSSAFENVTSLVAQWNKVFVGTAKGQLTELTEMDLSAKLDILFRKNLFSIAIAVASSRDCDEKLIMEIYQMYGDHLYEKCDYTNAMEQYLMAMDYVEPSYVIRRFLDARRINNLTKYLEALHQSGRANGDHTTLLLNCYTKLKDMSKMDEFVKTKSQFDVVCAIRVCRKSGYYQHALTLAERHKDYQAYIAIQIEDLKEVEIALNFIWSLDFEHCKRFVGEYGRVLLANRPDETVELIVSLCVHFQPRAMKKKQSELEGKQEDDRLDEQEEVELLSSNTDSNGGVRQRALPEEFIHLFAENSEKLLWILEEVSKQVECSATVYNTMLELYLRDGEPEPVPSSSSSSSSSSSAAAAAEGKTAPSSTAQNSNAHKIMNLLKAQPPRYDMNHALVLTRMYDFEKGILYLCGKLQLYNEIVQHHMDRHQHGKVIKACKKFSDMDNQLWVNALVYFARKKTPCEAEIVQVLDNVDRLNLLPPLIVVQILASSENAKPLTVVKDYIVRTLQREQGTIRGDVKEIARLEEESKSMRDEIHALRNHVTTFQEINCHHCGLQLQLPAVHFLCMHSYHQHCIVDNDKECPECAPERNKVMEIKESLKSSAEQHDRFFKQLKESKDSFATVAEYFGRGQ